MSAQPQSVSAQVFNIAKDLSGAKTVEIINSAKSSFLDLVGSLLSPTDVERVGERFDMAVKAKLKSFAATTPEAAQDAHDEYDTIMLSIETIGDQYLIVGKAKAGVFVRSLLHNLISGAFAVLGGVLQAALGIALPGVGSLLGAGANAGLQHAVHYFMGG